jgi:hypothetical protein
VQQAELTAGDAATYDLFGDAVAISGDTALVGAPYHDEVGKLNAGAVYVFVRSGGVWIAQAKLIASDGAAGDFFGDAVAISGDTALVGAPYHDSVGKPNAGVAYVFVRSAGSWTAQARLIAADGAAADCLGDAVAISGDTALVGASGHDNAGKPDAGAAYVFVRSAGSWTAQARLTAADGATLDQFGFSLDISGETALVGAPAHDTAGKNNAGAAYVFTRSAASWAQQAKPIAADGAAGDYFGFSVALSGDTALVGAPNHGIAGKNNAGAAYVFTRSAASWTQQAEPLAADGATGDSFGRSVAISGETALVGAPLHHVAGKADVGAAYIFTRSAASWTQQAEPIAVDGAVDDAFGIAVAFSGDTALVSAPLRDVAGKVDAGAAYVFLSTPTITGFTPASGPVGTTVTLTGSGFTGATAVRFNGVAATTYAAASATQITATVPAGATSGTIAVATPGGTATSASSFTVTTPIPAPTITSFTPATGPVGTTVTLTGSGFTGATAVRFNGVAATTYAVVSATLITANVPAGATTGTIAVATPGGIATSASVFIVTTPIPAPTITSFTPATGPVGTTVTLTGSDFTGAGVVRFNGAPAAVFTVDSDVQITVTVPADATSGAIAVTTFAGTATSATSFTVISAPSITKLKPVSAKRGATVTISGTGFGAARGTSSVRFGSTTCTKYTSWSNAQIKCKVPAAAKYGSLKVTVKTAAGTSIGKSFTVKR